MKRDFNDFLSEALERNRLAGDAVRSQHAKQPLVGREAIRAAFERELARLAEAAHEFAGLEITGRPN